MKQAMLLFCALVPLSMGLTSCRTVAPPPVGDEDDCEWVKPEGDPSAFTLAGSESDGVSIAAPLECKWGSQYIELRGSGTRQLMLAQEMPEGAEKCRQPPKGPDKCPQIQVDFFVASVWHKLSDAGIYTLGAGRGPCGDVEGDYDAWNYSVGISDWSRADEAAQIVAAEMARWGIGNQVGLAVRNAFCGTPATE